MSQETLLRELGEFFGVGEDLEGLDAKYNASPCSRIKARTFKNTYRCYVDNCYHDIKIMLKNLN